MDKKDQLYYLKDKHLGIYYNVEEYTYLVITQDRDKKPMSEAVADAFIAKNKDLIKEKVKS